MEQMVCIRNEDGNANNSSDYLCQGHSHGTDGRRLNVHQLLHRAQSLAHTHTYTQQSTPTHPRAAVQAHRHTNTRRGLMEKKFGEKCQLRLNRIRKIKGRNSSLLFIEVLKHKFKRERKQKIRWKERLTEHRKEGKSKSS